MGVRLHHLVLIMKVKHQLNIVLSAHNNGHIVQVVVVIKMFIVMGIMNHGIQNNAAIMETIVGVVQILIALDMRIAQFIIIEIYIALK
jgi:hypothetical protein